MDWKLELVVIPVSDVDRAKAFYTEKVGFNADHDHTVSDEIRFVQLTPPVSACSIAFGKGLVEGAPGSVKGLQLVVSDVGRARPSWPTEAWRSATSRTPPWGSFVSFSDPDGNAWALQQLPARLPRTEARRALGASDTRSGSGPGRARWKPCPHATPRLRSTASSSAVSMPSAISTAPIVWGEPDERGRGRLSCRIRIHAVGEVEVELEDVRAQLQDMLETRVSGTGVVHRDVHAVCAECVERRQESPVVVKTRAFGQLEHDPLPGVRLARHASRASLDAVAGDALRGRNCSGSRFGSCWIVRLMAASSSSTPRPRSAASANHSFGGCRGVM